jgi:hypothetical protein
MTKHIVGQSVYQLTILFVLLFAGPNFIKETQSDYVNYGFALKYCYNAPVKVVPDIIDPKTIPNPEQYLAQQNPDVYLISGFISSFSDSNNANFANATYCNKIFDKSLKMKDGYAIFKSVQFHLQ